MKNKPAILYQVPFMAGLYLSPQDNEHLLSKTNAVRMVKPHKKIRALLLDKGLFNHELGR